MPTCTSSRETARAIESHWLPAMQSTRLYCYELAGEAFELLDASAGYWITKGEVVPLSVEPIGDLLAALANAGVELRIMPSLWPLHDAVITSSLGFSIIRWRNAAPREGVQDDHDASRP
jgi:hypothetical protein